MLLHDEQDERRHDVQCRDHHDQANGERTAIFSSHSAEKSDRFIIAQSWPVYSLPTEAAGRLAAGGGTSLAGLRAGLGAGTDAALVNNDALGRNRLGEMNQARGVLGASNQGMATGVQGARAQSVNVQDSYVNALMADAQNRLGIAQGKNAVLSNNVNNRMGLAGSYQTGVTNAEIAANAARAQYAGTLLNQYRTASGLGTELGAD